MQAGPGAHATQTSRVKEGVQSFGYERNRGTAAPQVCPTCHQTVIASDGYCPDAARP